MTILRVLIIGAIHGRTKIKLAEDVRLSYCQLTDIFILIDNRIVCDRQRIVLNVSFTGKLVNICLLNTSFTRINPSIIFITNAFVWALSLIVDLTNFRTGFTLPDRFGIGTTILARWTDFTLDIV